MLTSPNFKQCMRLAPACKSIVSRVAANRWSGGTAPPTTATRRLLARASMLKSRERERERRARIAIRHRAGERGGRGARAHLSASDSSPGNHFDISELDCFGKGGNERSDQSQAFSDGQGTMEAGHGCGQDQALEDFSL